MLPPVGIFRLGSKFLPAPFKNCLLAFSLMLFTYLGIFYQKLATTTVFAGNIKAVIGLALDECFKCVLVGVC
jgi:ascorbate-specific PTS system EIIC-type component UlaA